MSTRTVPEDGGESTLASAWHVYNEMLRRHPDLAHARPVYRDRRGEIPPGKSPWYALPVFNFRQRYLSVCSEPSYIDSVARFFDANPNSPLQLEALAKLDALAEELHLDIAFEQGDMQFLNIHTVLHSRQAFEDHDEPARKRLLLRIWLLAEDGPPLSRDYFGRNGDPTSGRRPGGIVGADTVAHCSLEGI